MHHTRLLLSVCAITLMAASCKKKTTASAPCGAAVYGYSTAHANLLDTVAPMTTGLINTSTASISSIGMANTSTYASQSAYNSADGCYYTFRTRMGSGEGRAVLYKITASGAVTALTGPMTSHYSLTYSQVANKLYCLTGSTAGPVLTEVTVSGSTFNTVTVAAPLHAVSSPTAGANSTVNKNTGDIYYTTYDASNTYIEKYVPGGTTSVVATIPAGSYDMILGLSYNRNDNMLYAIKRNGGTAATADDYVKINPLSGAVTILSSLPFKVNFELYSACVDACKERYYISSVDMGTGTWVTCYLKQLSLTGAMVQADTTADLLQGIYVAD